jgi:hypothetical protein
MTILSRIESTEATVVGFSVMISGRPVEVYLPGAGITPAEGAKASVAAADAPTVSWVGGKAKVQAGVVRDMTIDGLTVDLGALAVA